MRIAQIMLAKSFGGAERSFVDLSCELCARGHEVLAVAAPRGRALELLSDTAGVTLHTVTVRGSWDILAQGRIRRALQAFAPVVVQCHLARAAHLGGRAAAAVGVPSLAKTHNYVNLKYYRDIGHLVPTTVSQRDFLLAHGWEPQRITQIPNFSALQALSKAPRTDTRRLLSMGRFVAKKGFDVLITALAQLHREGIDCRLTLAGDGPQRNALMNLVARSGLSAKVDFPGWVDNVAALLARADVFVLPSRDEPFGIVLLEAMAAGVPIVCTTTSGPEEILDAGSARFVAVNDAPNLAAAIAELLADAASAAALGHAAQDRFATTYAAAVVVPQYEALYERLSRAVQ